MALCARMAFLVGALMLPLSGMAVAPRIMAGVDASIFLNADGSVWAAGRNTAPSPVRVLQLADVLGVATDRGSNLALLADGTLWGAGGGSPMLLGDTTNRNLNLLQPVAGIADVASMSVSGTHVLALRRDGTVWAWGGNESGQLGDGTLTDRLSPRPVLGLADIVAVSAAHISSLALRSDGTVWVWGQTCCGAAGDGKAITGPNDPNLLRRIPTQVLNLDQVIAVAAGPGHHLALRADGTVWSWGSNSVGQNGLGIAGGPPNQLPRQVPGLDQVIAIVEDSASSPIALKSDGTVWGWGSNSFGQLGVSTLSYSPSPVQIPDLSDIVAISGSMTHRLALRRDGTVFAWGSNGSGQLGDNTLQDRGQPVPVSGPGSTGQLNLAQPAPASVNRLPTATIVLSPASGHAPLIVQASAAKATDPDGVVKTYTWKTSAGQEASGQSATLTFGTAGTYSIDLLVEDDAGGRGHVVSSVLATPAASAAVSAAPKVRVGSTVSVALASDGRVLAWGASIWMGLYDYQDLHNQNRGPPSAISLPVASGLAGVVDVSVAGNSAVHVLLADGRVLGWGSNGVGQVGTGANTGNTNQPQLLTALPAVQKLASGRVHELALTRDGRVYAWGGNVDGQLGLGDNQNRFLPTEIAGLADVIEITAGISFSAALKADGTVWAWGYNKTSVLGDGNTAASNRPIRVQGLPAIKRIFASGNGLFAQAADGAMWLSGVSAVRDSAYGYTGSTTVARPFPALDGAVQIAGEFTHVLVLRPDGSVWSGGLRGDLALGYPDADFTGRFVQLPGIDDAIDVAVGSANSAVLRRDGTVLSWGLNDLGQVGNGTLALQPAPVLVLNETASGFLDLIPEVSNVISRNKIPPFFVATYSTGAPGSTTLYADLRGPIPSGATASASDTGRFAAGYNIYVAANVPASTAVPYFQLHPDYSWSALRWPMTQFMSNVALESQNDFVRATILENADLSSSEFANASVIAGYGTDPDEMLRSARYRTLFTVMPPSQ